MKILCTVDQDVFHCQIFLTRYTDLLFYSNLTAHRHNYGHSVPRDLIVVCREQAVLCDDLYLTVIHILMWAALNEACY